MNWLPGNSGRPGAGSIVARWLERNRRHPEAFTCGVRAVGSTRWQFRPSGVDPYRPDGVVELQHGSDAPLRLRVHGVRGAGGRPDHALLTATDVATGAELELSVPLGDVARFGDF